MSYKNKFVPPPDLQNALTPEQKAKPPCRWVHRWETARIESMYDYKQCAKCFDRQEIRKYRGGHSPANWHWLEGGTWDYKMIAPPRSPASCVPIKPPITVRHEVTDEAQP